VRRVALFIAIAGLVASVAPSARAQDNGVSAPTRAGFAEGTNGIFTVENVFGFSETTESATLNGHDFSQSYTDKGFFPGLLGPRLGIFGASDHVTYGMVFGLWWAKPVGQGSDGSGSVFSGTIGPRIGYAGSVPKQPILGYWLRTGPTFIYLHTESGSGGNNHNSGFIDWAFEAYGVIHPVDHFGIFVGPSFDVALYGKASDQDEKLGVVNIGIGLLGDW
jgi:hypothetical protein